MRKLLLRLLSDDTDRLDVLEGRITELEMQVRDLNPGIAPKEPGKPAARKRIVTRTMSDYRQAMREEQIHVPQG